MSKMKKTAAQVRRLMGALGAFGEEMLHNQIGRVDDAHNPNSPVNQQLMTAARKGDITTIENLMDEHQTLEWDSAATMAGFDQHFNVIVVLAPRLQDQANIGYVMFQAAQAGHVEAFEAMNARLIQPLPVQALNECLEAAINVGSLTLVKRLAEMGGDLMALEEELHFHPLLRAAAGQYQDVFDFLYDQFDAKSLHQEYQRRKRNKDKDYEEMWEAARPMFYQRWNSEQQAKALARATKSASPAKQRGRKM